MLTRTVVTHSRCNQACTHCTSRATHDDPRLVETRAVLARIEEAARDRPAEIVLTGGEPTMRRDLPTLVRAIVARGARAILETNATLLDAARVRALKAAGLGLARVNLARVDARLDEVTRDPGGRDATLAGLRALLAEGIEVEIAIAITAETIDGIAAVPPLVASLPRTGGPPGVVAQYVLESADPSGVVDQPSFAAAMTALSRACEEAGLPLRLAPEASAPACMLPRAVRGSRHGRGVATVSTRSDGPRAGHRPIAACAVCEMRDRCAGIPERYLARFGAPSVAPIEGALARRRLTLAGSVQAQVESELVQWSHARDERGLVREAIVRVVFRCNQACRFCFVSTHLPDAERARVERALEDATARGERIVLSGGEPTLSPHLVDYVRYARARTRARITLQTNAVRLAEPGLAAALREAGVDEATVSLHGATAATSDAITEAPGTFDKTLRGIDALREAGIAVVINFVICGRNLHELPDHVALVASRWPGQAINVSFVAASTDLVPRDTETIPRYTDVRPHLARALAVAQERGVPVHGFEAMCGMPLCTIPIDPSRYLHLEAIADGTDRGEFVRGEACDGCALRGACWGVRKGYAALYGTGELRRVSLPAT